MTQSDSHQKAMSQVRRLPEENPERGTHCTFLAGRWQNSNSTKPPLIGQAYFSTCCGGRLLLVALPLSQEIVDSSNNCSLFEMQGYRFCPGNRNLAALIYSEIPNLFLKPCIHNSIIYIYIYMSLGPTSAEIHPPTIQIVHVYNFVYNVVSRNPSVPPAIISM